MDPVSTKELYQMIHKLNQEQKMTIVMVTHDIDRALEYANKILYLKKKMLFFGTTDQYLSCDICEKQLQYAKEIADRNNFSRFTAHI